MAKDIAVTAGGVDSREHPHPIQRPSYLTETETWEFLRRTAELASEKGENWTQYTISFLLGRTIQGFELDDIDIECRTLIRGKGGSLEKVEDLDIYTRYSFK